MTQKSKTSSQLNKDYFQSLIATRASLGMLGTAWAGVCIGGLLTLVVWGTGLDFGWNPPYDVATASALFSLAFMTCSQLVMLVEPLRKFFYQHQRFSSIWQIAFMVVLMYQLVFLAFAMVISRDSRFIIYTSPWTIPYILCASLFYLLCIIYNIFWLRSQLRKGMSEERRLKNYMAKPAVWGTGSLIFIFGGSMLGRILTGSFVSVFGIGATILFISLYSRLHIEYAYAAILKWRDKSYWEEYCETDGLSRSQGRSLVRLVLEIALFVAIIYVGMQVLPQTHPLVPVMRMGALGMIVYWIIRFVRWIRKK